jgi:hypothetical protein
MGFQCPACASPTIGRAPFLWSDLPQALLWRAAYRCRACGQRFFAPRRPATDLPSQPPLKSAHEGIRPVGQASKDRRSSVRFRCDLMASEYHGPGADQIVCTGRVLNLSDGGLHLVLARRAEAGSDIHLRIQPEGTDVVMTVTAQVLSIFPLPESQWALACRFREPLPKEDLKALLRR